MRSAPIGARPTVAAFTIALRRSHRSACCPRAFGKFYLGDEEAQAAHEKEMAERDGMTHDGPEGIAVKPGETKELTYTFAHAGETLAGCHVVGHYDGGMKATITVTG